MPPLFHGREGRRQLLVVIATSAVVIVVVVLLVGISPPSRPTGTLRSVEVKIVGQGTTAAGLGWFGPQDINHSGVADGYPFAFDLGSSINYSLSVVNGDRVAHNVSSVAVNAPFELRAMSPTLPYQVDGGEDPLLTLTLGTPTSSGGYSLVITITTYG